MRRSLPKPVDPIHPGAWSLGVQPPTAEWGIMVSEGRSVIFTAPHAAALPGLAITLLVVAFNLVGDGLRDALDPRVAATLEEGQR